MKIHVNGEVEVSEDRYYDALEELRRETGAMPTTCALMQRLLGEPATVASARRKTVFSAPAPFNGFQPGEAGWRGEM